MHHRIRSAFLSTSLLSTLLLAACASGDTSGSRTLLRLAGADCANPEEVCTASYPARCYTVCADEEPPECTPEERDLHRELPADVPLDLPRRRRRV
jgi:hypothetical protein